MANLVYTNFVHYLLQGAFNWRESATTSPAGVASQSNVKGMLVMTNSTTGPAGTVNGAGVADNVLNLGAFTTLDEFDGSGYAGGFAGAGRLALASQAVALDTTGKRTQGQSTPNTFAWTTLGAGTRQVKALLLIFQPNGATTDADVIPAAYIDSISGGQSFPFATSGGNVTITSAASGWVVGGAVLNPGGTVNFTLT